MIGASALQRPGQTTVTLMGDNQSFAKAALEIARDPQASWIRMVGALAGPTAGVKAFALTYANGSEPEVSIQGVSYKLNEIIGITQTLLQQLPQQQQTGQYENLLDAINEVQGGPLTLNAGQAFRQAANGNGGTVSHIVAEKQTRKTRRGRQARA